MKSFVSAVLCVALLSACSWRQLNPLNWFGGSRAEPVAAADAPVSDGSILILQILNARAERTPKGVIVHATGMAAFQGAHDAALQAAYAGDGSFSHLEFRIRLPEAAVTGTGASRLVVAAGFFTRAEAAAIGQVSIAGAQNSVTVSLR